jgi:prepilin-type N-terminal cleavage/methylation domain-containing protein
MFKQTLQKSCKCGFGLRQGLARNKAGGFTMIELLVVISIIGLLGSIMLVAINAQRQKSRDAKRLSDMNQVFKAFELYFNDNFRYPTSQGNDSMTLDSINPNPPLVPKYLNRLPVAVTPADGNCTTANNSYIFNTVGVPSNGSSYAINFCLGGDTGSLSAGRHTLTPSGFR